MAAVLDQESAIAARRYDRVSMRAQVDLHSCDNFYTGLSENISEGGLFIRTDAPLAVGDELDIDLLIMDYGPYTYRCRVMWVRQSEPGSGLPNGMGCSFVDLPEDHRTFLQQFIDSRLRESLYYDLD